jgi:protein-tyrosine phosphatase
MTSKLKLLVLCGRNKKRSRTAEFIYKNDPRLEIRSAGISPSSVRKVSDNDMNWAELVLVMEKNQKNKVKEMFSHLELPQIDVLDIPDEYEFMDEELITMLKSSINTYL